MSQLSEAIEKIRQLCPPALKPGLSRSEIDALLQDFPYRLPDEVYEFYHLSNGLGEIDQFSTLFEILSLSEAVFNYRYYYETFSGYKKEWLPLVELEDHLLVMSCNQKAHNLIDLGDNFTACDFADDETSALRSLRTLTTAVVSAADCFEREFKMCGRCWVRKDIFYPA